MGDYEDVLASLDTLNLSILKAMDYTKRVSQQYNIDLWYSVLALFSFSVSNNSVAWASWLYFHS